MNWITLCLKLGLDLPSDASEQDARARVIAHLGLAADADDATVQAQLQQQRPAHHPRAVLASGDWWTIRAAAEPEVADLMIYGDIGEHWYGGESVTAQSLVSQLQTIEAQTIIVHINSYGGSVADGVAIYNALRRHPANIITDVEGVAFSIASLIAMAGDTVRMAQNSMMMIHAPWGSLAGNAVQMRRYADVLDRFSEAMLSSYTRKSGADRADEIRQMLTGDTDHYLSPSEAIELGLVDEINESLAVAAHFDLSRFRGLPAAAAAFTRKESSMNWKAIAKALGLPDSTPIASIKSRLLELGLDPESATPEQVTARLAAAPAAPAAAVATPVETPEQVQARITARNRDIRAAFSPFLQRQGVAELQMDVLADASLSAEAARNRLLAHLGQSAEPMAGAVQAGQDASDKRTEAMVLATLQRAGVRKDPDTGKSIILDGANPYRGLTLRELARASLAASGRNPSGMEVMDVARAVLVRAAGGQSTSDFSVFLENTLHKMVLTGFLAAPSVFARFAKIGTVTDLREWNRIVPGMIANLQDVNQAGEYKNKNLPDGEKEAIRAKRMGNILEITPETIINDDLGAITDTALQLGAAGPRTIDRRVFDLLSLNSGAGPVLKKDNKTLIHADHGNANTGAASVTLISAMAEKMARQTLPGDDAEFLDLGPAISVSRHSVAGDIKVIIESQFDPDANNKLQRHNKVRGALRDVVETARMPANAFYLFADPNLAPVIEVVFLDGIQQVRVVQEENFRTGGLAWRGELNAGVGAIDYRGIQHSTGV
jgi:ATP-dependent Clp endopeptidase proteolytic subunit ClpP